LSETTATAKLASLRLKQTDCSAYGTAETGHEPDANRTSVEFVSAAFNLLGLSQ